MLASRRRGIMCLQGSSRIWPFIPEARTEGEDRTASQLVAAHTVCIYLNCTDQSRAKGEKERDVDPVARSATSL